MNINTLIFDRTQADVDRVKELNAKAMAGTLTSAERTEWASNMKGAYNSSDVNRVCKAVRYISDKLTGFPGELEAYRLSKEVYQNPALTVPYNPSDIIVSPKTDWAMTDYMNETAMNTYISDIATLREVLELPGGTPEAPATGQKMTFRIANDIEKILFDVGAEFNNLKDRLFRLIDLLAAAGTNWKKFACAREDREVHQSDETEWLPSSVQTDPTGAMTATGYRDYRLEYNEEQGRFVYVTYGDLVTISEGVVYNVTDNTAITRHLLSADSSGLQTMAAELRMVSTVTTTRVFYHKGDYLETINTKGYDLPDDQYESEAVIEQDEDGPLELVMLDSLAGEHYYYIRQQNTSMLGQAILGVMILS